MSTHGLHKRQSLELLIFKQGNAFVGPHINVCRFCAHEGWGQDHLVANDQTIDGQMMPHQLPAPWLGGGWLSKKGEIKTPLTKHFGVTSQLT